MELNCFICNIKFIPSHNRNIKYCSASCKKEGLKKKKKEWLLKNKSKQLAYKKKNREKSRSNPDAVQKQLDYVKDWRKRNKTYSKKYTRKYHKKRRQEDPTFKMLSSLRVRLKKYVRLSKIKDVSTLKEIIGCSPEYLRKHLERQFTDGMSWKNHTTTGWHIDHIVPLSSAKTSNELEKLMHYTNLQPLWASDNMEKSNK